MSYLIFHKSWYNLGDGFEIWTDTIKPNQNLMVKIQISCSKSSWPPGSAGTATKENRRVQLRYWVTANLLSEEGSHALLLFDGCRTDNRWQKRGTTREGSTAAAGCFCDLTVKAVDSALGCAVSYRTSAVMEKKQKNFFSWRVCWKLKQSSLDQN